MHFRHFTTTRNKVTYIYVSLYAISRGFYLLTERYTINLLSRMWEYKSFSLIYSWYYVCFDVSYSHKVIYLMMLNYNKAWINDYLLLLYGDGIGLNSGEQKGPYEFFFTTSPTQSLFFMILVRPNQTLYLSILHRLSLS